MESENTENKMPTGDKLILLGNLLGALSMSLISVGVVLRTQTLPETPIFINTAATIPPTRPVGINPNSSYWDR